MADPEAIREAAEEILRRPEYREPAPSLVERGLRWLSDLFTETLAALAGGVPGGYVVGWILVASILIGTAVMLSRALPRRWVRPTDEPQPEQVRTDPRTSRHQWLERAVAAEARGEWREATMSRYRGLVAGLVEGNELDGSPGATTGEHRRALDGDERRRSAFDSVTRRFEDVWYGGQDAEAADPGRIVRLDEDLLAARRPSSRRSAPPGGP
jgi:hypothetical protein